MVQEFYLQTKSQQNIKQNINKIIKFRQKRRAKNTASGKSEFFNGLLNIIIPI